MTARTALLVPAILALAAAALSAPDLPDGVDDAWLATVRDALGLDDELPITTAGAPTLMISLEGDVEDAHLGGRVAPAGDVNGDGYSDVLVGANLFQLSPTDRTGAAWVFLGGPDGPDTTPCWFRTGVADGVSYGQAVACAGDVNGDGYADIAVGAPNQLGGHVYVHHGGSGGPSPTPDWDHGWVGSGLGGTSLCTAGDTDGDGYDDLVVGIPGDAMVQVFLGSADGLSTAGTRTVTGPAGSDFGRSVAFAGDIDADGRPDWVTGARYYGSTDAGRAFVIYGDGGFLSFSNMIAGEELGLQVAGAGDVDGDGYADVLVGSGGAVAPTYLYRGTASGLSTTPSWSVTNDPDPSDWFDAATAGDVNGDGYADVLLGCWTSDSLRGEARLYLGGPDGLAVDPVWSDAGDQAGEALGRVATAGDVDGDGFSDFVVGVMHHDGAYSGCGRVDCYRGSAEGLAPDNVWAVSPDFTNGMFGWSLDAAGDVNGDGFDDVIVGAPYTTNGDQNEGRAYLFLGSAAGVGAVPVWGAEGEQAQAGFGFSVAGAGDVNRDGYGDLLVGAPFMDGTAGLEGAVFLWYGGPGLTGFTTPATADWSFRSGQWHAWLGYSVACAGDVNGDGYADIAAGAPYYDAGTTDEGGVFVFHGSASGPSASADWFHDTAKPDCFYGGSVASAGDFNGDGYSDLIVGAENYDRAVDEVGLAFLYAGSASGLQPGAPFWYAEGDQAGEHFGFCVAGAGDVNGDGFDDVLVGAPDRDGSAVDSGQAFAWYGSDSPPRSGTPANADWAVAYPSDVHTGWSVAAAGDLDRDGYADVVVGTPFGDAFGTDDGWVMTFHGSAAGLTTAWDEWIFGKQDREQFGRCVAPAGDVDGDGYPDVLAAAPYYDHVVAEEGQARLFPGGGGSGPRRRALQLESDLSTRIGPGNASDSATGFGIAIPVRSAAGRVTAGVEFEIRPLGTSFSTYTHRTGLWYDTGAPGPDGSVDDQAGFYGGLAAETPHRWRARVVTGNPYFPASPWFGPARNDLGLAHVRTAESGTAVDDGPVPAPPAVTCYPNPFNPRTTFRFDLPAAGPVRLGLVDAAGRIVRTLVDGMLPAGVHEVPWTGRDDAGRPVASGVYLYRLERADGVHDGRVVLVR